MIGDGLVSNFSGLANGVVKSCHTVSIVSDNVEGAQGGALAAHVALRTKLRLGGLVCLSAFLPGLRRFPRLVQGRIGFPTLFCHGSSDGFISVEDGWRAFKVCFRTRGLDFRLGV